MWMEKGCGTSALQGCGGLKTHKIFPVFSIPPRDPAFLSPPAVPGDRGHLQVGNWAQKYWCSGASCGLWGAWGSQGLLRDESQICARFLTVFAGSCGGAALHQGGVKIPETSSSSESGNCEMGNLVSIKFSYTGSWQVQFSQEKYVFSHIFTSPASDCGIGKLKVGVLVKASVCLHLGWRNWSCSHLTTFFHVI